MSDDDLGPAMRALSERRRAFVMAMVEYPGITQWEAAVRAGYSNTAEGAKVRGHRLMQSQAVQEAIRECAGMRLHFNSLMAASVVVSIAENPEVSTKDRLKAAGMLLDRTGFGAVQTMNVNKTVVDTTTKGIEERIARAMERLSKLQVDKIVALAAPEPVKALIEGQFSEVKRDE